MLVRTLGDPTATATSIHFLLKAIALLALGAIRGIGAVVAIHRDVHHGAARLVHRGTEFLQVLRLGGTKMPVPGLDFADVEFFATVRCEIL